MIVQSKPAERELIPPTVLDIETEPTGNILAVGFAYFDKEPIYSIFGSFDDFLIFYKKLMKQAPKDIRDRLSKIYAHNGGGFDWIKFYEFLRDNNGIKDCSIIFDKSVKPIVINLTIPGISRQIKLLDSFRLIPASLKNITAKLGGEFVKINLEISHHELYKKDYQRFCEYLKMDCLGLQAALFNFLSILEREAGRNLGNIPATLPALALRLFTFSLGSNWIMTPHEKRLKELERACYHGGLVRVYQYGKFEKVTSIDGNSMFPSVMIDNYFPFSYVGAWTTRYYPEKLGLYEIDFFHDPNIPPFIYSTEKEDYITSGHTFVTSAELEYLSKLGGTFIVQSGYTFEHKAKIFKPFVSRWWGVRKKAQENNDPGLDYSAKILLNSLYGKFAQEETSYKGVFLKPDEVIKSMGEGILHAQLGDLFILKQAKEVKHQFVSISAFVTAYARIKLHQKQMEVINNGDLLLYSDTDSVHFQSNNPELYSEHINDLGGWKIEKQGTGVYLGKKLYSIDDKVKSKGIGSLEQTPKITLETMENIFNNDDRLSVTFGTFPTFKEMLSGQTACKFITRTRRIQVTGYEPYIFKRMEKDYLETYQAPNPFLEGYKYLYSIIKNIGGVSRYKDGYKNEEYNHSIPKGLRRKAGMRADQIAEYLKTYHPDLKIETENDLYDRLIELSIKIN